jgi:hypothetical protein
VGLSTLINDADAAAEATVSLDEFGTHIAGPKHDQG